MKPWEGVIDIPEGVCGEYSVEHHFKPAHKPISKFTMRSAVLGGHKHSKPLEFDHQTKWHRLLGPTGVWMTDLPVEQYQHDCELRDVKDGPVLMGGLGLGYAATVLAKRRGINQIVVVEKSKEVIELVEPYLKDRRHVIRVIHGDLFEFLKTFSHFRFAWAFYDIWQSDGEGTFFDIVCPLLELSKGMVPMDKVICWNEDVMRTQLLLGIQSRLYALTVMKDENITLDTLCEFRQTPYWDYAVPFFRCMRKFEIEEIKYPFNEMASWYARKFGRLDIDTITSALEAWHHVSLGR